MAGADYEVAEALAGLALVSGLRAILEDVLGPIMFEIPSVDDVAKVCWEVVRSSVTS